MKIVILAQSWLNDKKTTVNGTIVQLHNLSEAFAEKGHEVHYIAPTKDKRKPAAEYSQGIVFHWIHNSSFTLAWYKQIKKINKLLELIEPDVIYARGRTFMLYCGGKYANKAQRNGKSTKFIFNTNGEDGAEFGRNLSKLKSSNRSYLKKLLLQPLFRFEDKFIDEGMRLANTVINQSVVQRQLTKESLGKEGIILPSYFSIRESEEKKEYSILWIGSLSPSKQPEIFLNSLSMLKPGVWKGIVAGGTSDKMYERKLKKMKLNFPVYYTGTLAFGDTFKYYSRSRLMVHTSRPDSDGLPNAFIQSWLAGTPVLSLHHDPNGWMESEGIGFCAKGDIDLFNSKLKEFTENPTILEDMGVKAKEFSGKAFADKDIIDKYLKIFSKDISKKEQEECKHFAFVMPWHISQQVGGAEVQAAFLSSDLVKRGYKVSYICQSIDQSKVGTSEAIDGVEVFWLKNSGLFPVLDQMKYYHKLAEITPDIVVQRMTSNVTWVAAKYCNTKAIPFVWICTDNRSCHRNTHSKWVKEKFKFYSNPARWSIAWINGILQSYFSNKGKKMATYIFTQNDYQRDVILREYGKFSFRMLSGHPVPQTKAKENSNLAREKVVLWSSNLGRHKRPKLFIELAMRLRGEPLKFVMVGGHPNTKYMLELTKFIPNNLEMVGKRSFDDSIKYFDDAFIFVNTSKVEGFPNTYIQSWLRGVPTIVFGADPDDTIVDNKLGYNVTGVAKAAEQIKFLIRNPIEYKTLSDNALNYATGKHTIDLMSTNFLKAINSK